MQVPKTPKTDRHTGWELIVQFGLRFKIINVYGVEEYEPSSTDDPGDDLCELSCNGNDLRNQDSIEDFHASMFQCIEGLLKGRLESEYSKLEQEKNGEALLKEFVDSWRRYSAVIMWLQQTSPIFSTRSGNGNGKSLNQCVTELYAVLVLNKIDAAVREAAFLMIRSEKEGAEIDKDLMKSVSAVVYESQNWPLYETMWHEPVLRHFSQLYLQDKGKWFQEKGIKRLDGAITQASERIENYCPNEHMSRQAKSTLTGVGRIKNYLKLQEMMAGQNSEVSSIMSRMDLQELKRIYTICRQHKQLPLVGPVIHRCVTEELARRLTLEHFDTLNSFDFTLIHRLGESSAQAERIINCYDPASDDDDDDLPETPSSYKAETDSFVMMEQVGGSMKLQVEELLANEDSPLRAILRRNDNDEMQLMYAACLRLESYEEDVLEVILDYDMRDMVTVCWDLLKSTKGQWFENDSLAIVDSKIAEIFEFIDSRMMAEQEDIQHFRIMSEYRNFMEIELPKMFEDEESLISSVFMRRDLQEMERIYLLCSSLNHLKCVKLQVIRFEIGIYDKRALALFEEGRGKWFSENYLDKFDEEMNREERLMTNRWYFDDTEKAVVEEWIGGLQTRLSKEMEETSEDKDSEISAIFRRNDAEEIQRMYKQCDDTEQLRFLAGDIFDQHQEKKDHQAIRDCIAEGREKWFAGGWLTKVDSEITQAFARSTYYWELLEERTVEEFKRKTIKLFDDEFDLPKMLEDRDSEISGIFRRNSEREIVRMYQICHSLESLREVGTTLLRHDFRNWSKHITTLAIESLSKRLFEEDSFSKTIAEISKACVSIGQRCAGNVERGEEEKKKFRARLDDEVVLRMSTIKESIVSLLRNKSSKERERLCVRCDTLACLLPTVATTVLGLLLKIEGEQVLTEFHKSSGADLPQGAAKQEYPFTFVVDPLKPPLGVTVSLSEVEEFLSLLLNLRSKYKRREVECFGESEKLDSVLKEALSEVINLPTGNGESTITELLAGFVDLFMRNIGEGDTEARLRLTVQLLSVSDTRKRFRLLSEQYLEKRLVSFWDVGEPESAKHERNLINRLGQRFGLLYVDRMLEMITDFEKAQAIQQDVVLSTSGSENGINAVSGSFTLPRRSVKVLRNDLWHVSTEVQINLPPPLEEALSRFEHCYGKVEGQKEMDYIHSLGKITFETTLFAGKGNKSINLVGSVHQASILLLFNSQERNTFGDILDALQKKGCGQDYLRKTKALISAALQSLLSSECPLLVKNPKSEKLKKSDVLHINRRFITHEKVLQLPGVRPNACEEDQEESNLIESLPLMTAIKVAVMKVMKQKREMKLDKLFEEVVQYGKNHRVALSLFEFEFKDFKSQVDKLVDAGSLDSSEGSNPTITF